MNDYTAARTNMVDCQIHTSGVIDNDILAAFLETPREMFVPDSLRFVAYGDEDLPIGQGRYILAPALHARLLQYAAPVPSDRVLDVGGGTGYSAAIVARLCQTVVAVEAESAFVQRARQLWTDLGIKNIRWFQQDLAVGEPGHAPYDLIFLNGASAEIPRGLARQLAPHGRMICLIKKADALMARATLVKRSGSQGFSSQPLFEASAPYLPGMSPAPAFQF